MAKSLCALVTMAAAAMARHVSVTVDGSKTEGALPPFNQFYGCDEPNYAYYPHGSALIKELGGLGKQQTYFRTHNLLTTGKKDLVGVPGLKWGSTDAYTEDQDGNPVYNFTLTDKILDSYLASGVRPYLEVGFMPKAMATDPDPYFFNFDPANGANNIYTGWSHTPKSYKKWGELVYQWTKHNVERYGAEEVNQWWFEIWNEADIPYWNGTVNGFYELHDYAVDGIRRALSTARVGGPECAGGIGPDNWLGQFLNHTLGLNGVNKATGKKGTPLDFISWHAKGDPIYVNTTKGGYVQMNVSTQLQQIDQAFGLVASIPQYKDKPIFMSEYDPDSCAACTSAAYGYRNSLLYPAYNAASFIRALDLAAKYGVNLQGMLTWAFEYEPTALNPNETQYYDGYRVLSTQGVDKAIMAQQYMWAKMTGGQRVSAASDGQASLDTVLAQGVRGEPDVGAFASVSDDGNKLFIFLWHYHDNNLHFPDVAITTTASNVPGASKAGDKVKLTHWRIDNDHSNSYEAWVRMGSPQPPSQEQFGKLVKAGKLAMLHRPKTVKAGKNGSVNVRTTLPIRGTSLLVLEKA